MLTVITFSIFVSVGLLAGSLLFLLLSRDKTVQEKVARLMPQEYVRPELLSAPKKWQLMLSNMGRRLRVKPTELLNYRQKTVAAGFKSQSVYIFLGSKIFLAFTLPALYLMLIALPQAKLRSLDLLLAAAFTMGGFLAPSLWLDRRSTFRKEEIFHSLPDVLDLLTVCVEAGLSLDAALVRATETFQKKKDPLILEMTTTTLEIRAGKPRAEALKALAERTMVEDLKSLVMMLVQTEKFGTSLGRTLRTFSDSLRVKRRQLAEEKAAKTGIKMLFPLTFCIFPSLLVVMLVPAFFRIYGIFK